ncbi:MAG: hypothetical protein ACREEM_16475 [Blastocatellia bacterium]
MSAYSFPFDEHLPSVTVTLATPDPAIAGPPIRRHQMLADTGFSDYLQLDWDTFLALDLQQHAIGTINSELADGSLVTDLLASVRVIIPECGIDIVLRCVSSPGYGQDLLLVGSRFLKKCRAVIDYPQEQTTLAG